MSSINTQLSAWQILPAQFPILNGNPVEWPTFISAFDNNTSAAVFSNVEKYYDSNNTNNGSKDTKDILDRMIKKARRISVNKERLDSLIQFALAVRNICATKLAIHLDAHLNNLTLLRELVDKLPNK